MTTTNRVLEISKRLKLSHVGSCITALPIIEEIYETKEKDDKFVLSSGHAALALYVVLEKEYMIDAEMLFEKHGVHPNRDVENHIDCSTGSLGLGLPVALGMALADPGKNVYCLISDGECAEGSIWESLRIKTDHHVDNLKVYVNINGYSAYDKVDILALVHRINAFCPTTRMRLTSFDKYEFLNGIDAHYCTVPGDYEIK